jgi:two-component system, OmpR family, phosphate regulon sensor histidine kinase PhoR
MCIFGIMKKDKTLDIQRLLPSLTFIILVLLIIIQVNWIFRAARLEEQNFSHRVAMALKGARDEIGNRVPLCSDMSDFLCGRKCPEPIHNKKHHEVDSIISANLENYNISLPYTYEVTDAILHKSQGRLFTPASYLQNLNGVIDQNGIQIKILFPTRNQFLLGQIWGQLGFHFFSFCL